MSAAAASDMPPPRCLSRLACGALAVATVAMALLAFAGPVSAGPSPTDIKRQQQTAARLRQQVREQGGKARAAQDTLRVLAADANRALDAYQQARERTAAAEAVAEYRRQQLEEARAQKRAARDELNQYAAEAYTSNGAVGAGLGLIQALLDSRDVDDFAHGMTLLGSVGDYRGQVLQRLRATEATERFAASEAEAAAAAAVGDEVAQSIAKRQADALVARQRSLVAATDASLARTRMAAADAARRLGALERARRVAQQRVLTAKRDGNAASSGEQGQCTGQSLAGSANGRLPVAALCPVWGAPGQLLRGDAAAAFVGMSRAYAAEFGEPICVTDSYRPYVIQVTLFAQKPGLAAYPGTSEHGWGRATDLCGGVQNVGTRSHSWMQLNATRFGWFHPSWAEPNGNRPEPWHWEFGG